MKATPEPMVSGRYFLPKAALLWVKWRPAERGMSWNWIGEGCAGSCDWVDWRIGSELARRSAQARVPVLLKPSVRGFISRSLSGLIGVRMKICALDECSSAPFGPCVLSRAPQKRVRGLVGARDCLRDDCGGRGR